MGKHLVSQNQYLVRVVSLDTFRLLILPPADRLHVLKVVMIMSYLYLHFGSGQTYRVMSSSDHWALIEVTCHLIVWPQLPCENSSTATHFLSLNLVRDWCGSPLWQRLTFILIGANQLSICQLLHYSLPVVNYVNYKYCGKVSKQYS